MKPSQSQNGQFTSSIAGLLNKGLQFSSVIDVGCADGSFFLDHFDLGLFANASPLNIDANAVYEDSLRGIKDVLGGDYMIAAVSDAAGEIEFTNSVHPYWASVRPPGDPYWDRLNGLHAGTSRVPAVTLDSVVQSLQLQGPFLLKMDIQGGEVRALRGARQTLTQTDTVIVEADMADFESINATMLAAGFSLYDLTNFVWLKDGSLGWFYPVYLNDRRSDLKPGAWWAKDQDQTVVAAQLQRRKLILAENAYKLSKYRAGMWPKKEKSRAYRRGN